MNNKRIDYIAVRNCNLTSLRHSVSETTTYSAKSDTIQPQSLVIILLELWANYEHLSNVDLVWVLITTCEFALDFL